MNDRAQHMHAKLVQLGAKKVTESEAEHEILHWYFMRGKPVAISEIRGGQSAMMLVPMVEGGTPEGMGEQVEQFFGGTKC